MNDEKELNLVRDLARGDEAAFNEVYLRHRDPVYGFVYRMTCDRSAAEDITHETFIFLIENPTRYDLERSSLRTFLCTIARGRVMNLIRRKHRNDLQLADFDDLWVPPVDSKKDALAELLSQELVEHVEECITLLPPAHREVLILREYQELTYEEIAKITGTEVATVKTRLYRARQSMARTLAGYITPVETREYHEVY
jgi:RNA polymerase sigma-70 factor, ECF subfamily